MKLYRFTQVLLAWLFLFDPLALAKKVKIDLQWAICDKDSQTVLRKLGEEGTEPYKANNVTYYDSAPPEYTARGLAFRTKVKKHQPISMIKVRFSKKPKDIPSGAECVWDRYGSSIFYTCSLAWLLDNNDNNNGTQGYWSEEQIAFAEQYHDNVEWTDLVPYGPFWNPKWKLRIEGRKAVFDDVMAHVGGKPLHLMELEVKVPKKKGKKVYKKITKYLEDHGVVLCQPHQVAKTTRLFNALDRLETERPDDDDNQIVMGELRSHPRELKP